MHEDPLREIDSELAADVDTLPPFRVLMHNDHYTTMDFVVSVLERIFFKTPSEATEIMLKIHQNGVAICGEYSEQIAESKSSAVHRTARQNGFPLRCSVEQA